jgi:uncharacterized lipoprotein NlpE involved in copper resistance
MRPSSHHYALDVALRGPRSLAIRDVMALSALVRDQEAILGIREGSTRSLLRFTLRLSAKLDGDVVGTLRAYEACSCEGSRLCADSSGNLSAKSLRLYRLECTYLPRSARVHPQELVLLIDEHSLALDHLATPAPTVHAATLAASQAATRQNEDSEAGARHGAPPNPGFVPRQRDVLGLSDHWISLMGCCERANVIRLMRMPQPTYSDIGRRDVICQNVKYLNIYQHEKRYCVRTTNAGNYMVKGGRNT